MRVKFITLGCKTNQAESNKIASDLEVHGFQITDGECDVCVINTCAVTGVAERKSRHEVSKIARKYPQAKIIVVGCGIQKESGQFERLPNVVKTFGANKDEIVGYIVKELSDSSLCEQVTTSRENSSHKLTNVRTKTYIKIQDGCDNFCSFCIVPHLRGRSKCRTVEEIIAEIKEVNPKEIVLTGINLTAYRDGVKDLGDLCVVVNRLGISFEISSLYINIITPEFIEKLRACRNFKPNFHLSLQSGSDEILKKMNRHYTSSQFEKAVKLIRDNWVDTRISVDVIVGFPTESDKDFQETYDFCEKMRFDHIHIFPYSIRDGTTAASMPQVHSNIIKERASKLKKLTKI